MEQQSDETTKAYSWRVAILPFIGQTQLYSQYIFDEEWDSKSNLKVVAIRTKELKFWAYKEDYVTG